MVATITDGASLMVKFGKDTCPEHVTCYAHAIHLAVCDVLYKKTQHKPSEDFIHLVDHCESDTENDSIAEGEKRIKLFLWHLTCKMWCKKFEKL